MQNRTQNFMFRIGDYQDAEGWQKIDMIKKAVKQANKQIREDYAKEFPPSDMFRNFKPTTLRVCLKGRKPKQKFERRLWSWKEDKFVTRLRGHSHFGDILGGLENAGKIDVYLQYRYPEKFVPGFSTVFAKKFRTVIAAAFSE